MTSIPLIFGRLTTHDYSDEVAKDPRIDALRAKVRIVGPWSSNIPGADVNCVPNKNNQKKQTYCVQDQFCRWIFEA
jgi:MmgE/PrpD C-terminal domain